MPHFQKSPIGAVDSSTNDPEPAGTDLTGELIILSKECLFIKSPDLVESSFVNKHEHPRRERPVKSRESLRDVVAQIQRIVRPPAVPAQNVRSHAMQRLAFDQIYCASQQSGIRQFDIRIDEQKIAALRAPGAVIAADRWKSAADDRNG